MSTVLDTTQFARAKQAIPEAYTLWRSVWHAALGSAALGVLTFVCFRLQADVAASALLYLFVIVLTSLWASLAASLVVTAVAILCLDFFFTPPLFSVSIREAIDVIALLVFSTTAVVINRLLSRVHKSIEEIQALQAEVGLIIDTIPTPVWSALPDGSRDFTSRRWLEYTGLSSTDGLGWGWTGVLHPDDKATFVDAWKAALTSGEPFEAEARLRRADGQYRWFLVRAVPLRDERKIEKWFGTATDIEDRKLAVDVLRRSEATLREQASLLDLTHDTVFVRDMNDVITFWNRGAEELYGWRREEAVGTVTHDLLHTVFPAPLQEITATLLRASRWEGELVHTTRDGTRVTVASRWSLEQDESGRPVGTLETNNDITERKSADEALRRQANLLEQTHDAIFVWDFAGTIIFWNRGAEELYGFSRQEAMGRSSHELLQTEHGMPDIALRGGAGARRRVDGRADTDGARRAQDPGRKPARAGAPGRWRASGARNQPRHHRTEAGAGSRASSPGRAGARLTRHDPRRDGRVYRSRGRPAALGRCHQRQRLPAVPDWYTAESRGSARRPAGHRPRRPAGERRDRADSRPRAPHAD